jgi:hypothetical protein
MTDVDSAVGYLIAWAWRKARRIGGRIDRALDPGLQADLDRLDRVIAAELAGEPALNQLLFEAASDLDAPAVRPLTTERVRLALQDATEADPGSAVRLHHLVRQVQAKSEREPVTVSVTTSTDRSVTIRPGSPSQLTTSLSTPSITSPTCPTRS